MCFLPQLHIATANGFIDVVDYLLANNCPVHLKDNDEWQPVHAAACWGHVRITGLDGIYASLDLRGFT